MRPVKLGTKGEIFVMRPPVGFRNHAWTSDAAEKQMVEWKDGPRKKKKGEVTNGPTAPLGVLTC